MYIYELFQFCLKINQKPFGLFVFDGIRTKLKNRKWRTNYLNLEMQQEAPKIIKIAPTAIS